MEKLDMQTKNLADEKFEALKQLFPNAVTEAKNESGGVIRAIDKDILMQEIATRVVEGRDERYQFTWPDKRQAILAANAPLSKTLRPAREESVNFDDTENLYIEGDNLDVLKLLQETYLGKIKMIYIDPPYNTGSDFVYKDDFKQSAEEYIEGSGQYDEEGNRLEKNIETNGRFHTDWLNMIYPRLKLARNLLSDDGVIFISIDDNEQANLKKVCDEIFGEGNFIANLPTVMNLKGNNDEFGFAGTHEYTLVYIKDKNSIEDLYGITLDEEDKKEYNLSDEIGFYKKGATLMRTGEAGAREKRPKGYYPIYVDRNLSRMSLTRVDKDDIEVYPKTQTGKEMSWRRSPETLQSTLSEFIITGTIENVSFYKKQRLDEVEILGKKPKSIFYKPEYSSGNGTSIIKELFEDRIFDNPKPIELIKDFLSIGSRDDDIILDFFSGSATTAHAVMDLNAEDGGNRKYIMVQLPEETDEQSEAYKAGYKTICDIGKERIRRAGQKILEEHKDKEGIENLDIGFRVLKVDSSNMKDVYYEPDMTEQGFLDSLENNIKEDRSPEDLLFQVMLDLGIPLSADIQVETVGGKDVYVVEGGFCIACFDAHVGDEAVKDIAEKKPYYAVFRDASMANDSVATNFDQIFESISPETVRRVL